MCKLNIKRGYRRYMDFNHNRLVVLVKGWYESKLMLDLYYNEEFLGYLTTDRTWADLLETNDSNNIIESLMQEDAKLAEYSPKSLKMKLSEVDILFECGMFNLYVNVPAFQQPTLKVCNPTDTKEQVVLQEHLMKSSSYCNIFKECQDYMNNLEHLVDELTE